MPEFSLRNTLNRFYREYNFKERLRHDPIEFPHRYQNPHDIEVAGFIASCFAYGKVELFKPVIERVLSPCGKYPSRFFRKFILKKDEKYFKDINYRFNKENDILGLLYILSEALKRWGSLKNLFYNYYSPEQEDIGYALSNFIGFFLGVDTSEIYGEVKPGSLTFFFPSPEKGSTCKRLNLFLRWMVRTKDVDLGIWDKIPPSKLIIPLDTHIARISRCLGLTRRTSTDWKTAKEITESLKKLDPKDPLKYDFALCHLGIESYRQGISGLCRGQKSVNTCSTCDIFNN